MSEEVQEASAVEAPESGPVEPPVELPASEPVNPSPVAEPAAEPVDREALQAERRAVASALNMASTAGLGDAAALQAVYDDLGAKLEALV